MERRLADLAAPDVNLGAVPEQRLHHRRLPGLHRQVQRGVIVLRRRAYTVETVYYLVYDEINGPIVCMCTISRLWWRRRSRPC